MADEKLNTGSKDNKLLEAAVPPGASDPPAPESGKSPGDPPGHEQAVIPGMVEDTPVPAGKVIDLSGIKAAADHSGKGPTAPDVVAKPPETAPNQKRRGRPPKAKPEVGASKQGKTAESHTGRPSKVDTAARDGARPSVLDKVSRDGTDAKGKKKGPGGAPAAKPGKAIKTPKAAPAKESAPEPPKIDLPPVPPVPPRPVEETKIVYLKLSELHPFHTFREHPYKVQDDRAMDDLVDTIKIHGVMTPATVRPEKDGKGYEIIAGHRRHHGSGRAGLEEMPCIVRDMTDLEAVREMRNSNKQRGDPLPSELARLLELEVAAIKHQGARPKNEQEREFLGKRSVEIVGKEHDLNYKKVLRYLRLNHLVPELLDKVDAKNMGFMPAVELSYIRPENQRLIAVSIDGEQASPSVKQAKKLRELDQEDKLSGDVIDGILSEQKKEVDNVIISTDELNKYFGKEVTPRQMKDQIMALLDEWKEKQPPEKKAELEK